MMSDILKLETSLYLKNPTNEEIYIKVVLKSFLSSYFFLRKFCIAYASVR